MSLSPGSFEKVEPMVLPGEDFVVSVNDSKEEKPVEQDAVQKTFSSMDELVDGSWDVEETLEGNANVSHTKQAGLANDEKASLQGAGTFFNTSEQHFTNYTALEHLMNAPGDMSHHTHKNGSMDTNVKNDHNDSTTEPLELSYHNFGSHQYAEDSAPARDPSDPHSNDIENTPSTDDADHSCDGSGSNNQEVGNTVVGELADSHGSPPDITDEQAQRASEFSSQPCISPRVSRSMSDMNCFYSYRPNKARRREALTIKTQLDDIEELAENEDHFVPPSPCSESSSEFSGLRGFVQALPVRRAGFLD